MNNPSDEMNCFGAFRCNKGPLSLIYTVLHQKQAKNTPETCATTACKQKGADSRLKGHAGTIGRVMGE
jgi:hypothetical protein